MKARTAQKKKQTAESTEFRDLKRRLARNVTRLRADLNESQEEMAHRCNMPTRVFARVEAGDSNVTLATLARLGRGFGVEADELLRRER